MLLKIGHVEQEQTDRQKVGQTDRQTDKEQTDKQTTISSARPKIFQMVWGLKVHYHSHVMDHITSPYPPMCP
jgi:hypothetical protein